MLFHFALAGGTAFCQNNPKYRITLDNGIIRLQWNGYPTQGLYLETKLSNGKWAKTGRLTGKNIADVQFFANSNQVPSDTAQWLVKKTGSYSLKMVTYLGNRQFIRNVYLSRDSALIHVSVQIHLNGEEITDHILDNWIFNSSKKPDFIWVPNLRPGPDMVIGDHVFRSPAIILKNADQWIVMIPNLDTLAVLKRQNLTSMNLDIKDHPQPLFSYGFKAYTPIPHTYYRHADSSQLTLKAGNYSYAYDLLAGGNQTRTNVLKTVTHYLWNRYAAKYTKSVLPQTIPFSKYAHYSYTTLDSIGQFVNFNINNIEVGAYKGIDHGGYFRLPYPIIWNQDWFNVQRSAYGLRYYGELLHNSKWIRQANLITKFSLNSPRRDGLFPAIYDYKNGEWIGSVPRLNGGKNRIHTSNSAWTTYWLLKWYEDFDKNPEILKNANQLGRFLVENQLKSGAIPSWFILSENKKQKPVAVQTLKVSAETAGSALLFGELFSITKDDVYKSALIKSADFLIHDVLPDMKFWDFETFWSCSWKPLDMHDPYTGVLPQNNFSIYWTAKVLLDAYAITRQKKYLNSAEETLAILSLYQQVWNPPYLSLYTFGGFGVMNTDGEWNDARQAVFAPLYLQAYQLTGDKEYFERGIAALRASFVLMSIPENKKVGPDTWKAYPVGLMPENFAHGGINGTYGRSDTDWGEAGALAASAFITNHYGDVYIDVGHNNAFGINGCRVEEFKKKGNLVMLKIKEELGYARNIVLKDNNGKRYSKFIGANASATYEFHI